MGRRRLQAMHRRESMGESHGNQARVTVTNLGTCISRKNKENNHVFVYPLQCVKYMIASLNSTTTLFPTTELV